MDETIEMVETIEMGEMVGTVGTVETVETFETLETVEFLKRLNVYRDPYDFLFMNFDEPWDQVYHRNFSKLILDA